jgi:hypothetical protein
MRIAGKAIQAITLIAASLSLAIGQAPQQPAPAPAGPVGGGSPTYQRAQSLPARITKFTAEPGSLQPGQSFNLIWATENPNGVSIDPGLGRVTARGSRQL